MSYLVLYGEPKRRITKGFNAMTKEDIGTELNNLITGLNDEQFKEWVMSWLSVDWIMDTVRDWDEETKQEEIKALKDKIKQ